MLLRKHLLQAELRKAALERSGGGSRKVVLPPKDPKDTSEPIVASIDKLTKSQVDWLLLYAITKCDCGKGAFPVFQRVLASTVYYRNQFACSRTQESCSFRDAEGFILFMQRKILVGRAFETEDQDALRFLTKIKERTDK